MTDDVDINRRKILSTTSALIGAVALGKAAKSYAAPIEPNDTSEKGRPMDITIFVFDDVTALDAIGPYEALRRLPDVRIRFAGISKGAVSTGGQSLQLVATDAIRDVARTDLLLIPGGVPDGLKAMMPNTEFHEWVRHINSGTRWTTSVCSGALLLGAAGLLKGLQASTHWRSKAALPKFGATYSGQRITTSGKIITAAGVSAAVDMGIYLCALIASEQIARAVQLAIEYRPEPPFTVGTSEQEPELVSIVEHVLRT
jgi:putative intracellular protease/amidase